ncbi:Zinc finger SWIM domain-containing protein 7 [Lamellibrachia satsuma]|nr:Zinc finger SWIM domain-containing protein 7 [Lamellibrachia satsuma]
MLDQIARQLFDEVSQSHREYGSLTDEILSALHVVFQAPLLAALDLVDHHQVTRLTSPSGRTVCQVIGSSGTPYTCLLTIDYCGCPSYQFSESLLSSLSKNTAGTGMVASSHVSDYESSASLTVAACTGKNL